MTWTVAGIALPVLLLAAFGLAMSGVEWAATGCVVGVMVCFVVLIARKPGR